MTVLAPAQQKAGWKGENAPKRPNLLDLVNPEFAALFVPDRAKLGMTEAPPTPRAGCGLDAYAEDDPRLSAAALKARKILGRDIPLLIEGETGTGKEMFARAFHHSGPRRDKPFIALNCAAIPEGLIEAELFGYQEGAFTGARKRGNLGKVLQADGGTLFLDEIGDMPLNLQARLLRVLQEREVVPLGASKAIPVDIVLVTATNRRLRDEVDRGGFREDLYYRVNGLRLTLPPLRERFDIDALIQRVTLEESGPDRRVMLDTDTLALLSAYRWPGNIRQLRSVLRTALALLGDEEVITRDHLPEDILEEMEGMPGSAPISSRPSATPMFSLPPDAPLPINSAVEDSCGNLADIELAAIRRTLKDCAGNVSAAARHLGVSRNTLYRKLGRL